MFQSIMAGCAGIGAVITALSTATAVLQNRTMNQTLAAQNAALIGIGRALGAHAPSPSAGASVAAKA